MNEAKVLNTNGESILYSRLVDWSKNNTEDVVLVADDGTNVKVNRLVFEFFSYLFSSIAL